MFQIVREIIEKSTWTFKRIREGDSAHDPKPSDKFDPFSCILEFIQNALDALRKDLDKVKIKIYASELDIDEFKNCFFQADFKKFYEFTENPRKHDLVSYNKNIKCLVLEDYNTTGILGDPSVYKSELDDGQQNSIHRFNYEFGGKKKLRDATKGGSEGEGRQTFCLASDISTFFYFTKQEDGSEYFMGIFYAGIFKAFNEEYDPYARFGDRVESLEVSGNYWTLPISDKEKIKKFKKLFNIERDEPGTTVIIPFIDSQITLDEIFKEICESYRVSIHRDLIELQIGKQGKLLSKSNIVKEYNEKFSNNNQEIQATNEYFAFLESIEKKEIGSEQSITCNPSRPTRLDHVSISNEVKEAYKSGKTIQFKLPFKVYPRKIDGGRRTEQYLEKNTFVDIYFKKFSSNIDQEYKFNDTVRGFMPITSTRIKSKNFFLTDIQDEEAKLLAKTGEVANHTKIKGDHPKYKGLYKERTYYQIITLINNIFSAIELALTEDTDEVDETTTLDLCAIIADSDLDRDEQVISGELDDEDDNEQPIKSTKWKLPEIPGKLKAYKSEVISNGSQGWKVKGVKYTLQEVDEKKAQAETFITEAKKLIKEKPKGLKNKHIRQIKSDIISAENRIVDIENFKENGLTFYPRKIRIRAAYADGTRNPFKNYHKMDFDLADTKVFKFKYSGSVMITKNDENKIILEIENEDFDFQVTGFGKDSEEKIIIDHNHEALN